jgi:hypothetical protein
VAGVVRCIVDDFDVRESDETDNNEAKADGGKGLNVLGYRRCGLRPGDSGGSGERHFWIPFDLA